MNSIPARFSFVHLETEDIARFIGAYLGPELAPTNLKTKFTWAPLKDHRLNALTPCPALTSKFIKGVGFQHKFHRGGSTGNPHCHLCRSETECGNGSNNWNTWELMQHYMKNGNFRLCFLLEHGIR